MPRYQFLAVDRDGRNRSGGFDAADESAARRALQRRKLVLVKLEPASEAVPSRTRDAAPVGPRQALSHKQRLLVTRQFATLVDAAVPVDEALGMIAAQQDVALTRRVMSDVQAGIVEGLRLADALARHPRSFSPMYRAAIAGGERSGKLGFVLTRLADYLARSEAIRSKVTTAMVYPAALSLVALSVVTCLMIFVVPSLTEQFESFDTRLPLITQVLIGVSNFLARFWGVLLIGLAVGAYVASILLRREPVRAAIDAAMLRAPLVGKWVTAVQASRFVRAISTLTASGLPVLESVRAAHEAITNRAASTAAARMAAWIEEGEPLSRAMRKSGVIPPLVAYMAASGENAGDLSGMLEKAADHLDQEFEAVTATALSLLEPAIIIIMGVVVASIVLAIMLPILQLNRLAIG
ncbi:MAG: type II secretion system F family protein [Hyphomonadaceae bacterium]